MLSLPFVVALIATPWTPGTLPDLANADRYNGVDAKKFDKFWEKWPLITVRYRADNGEQRFIYGNDIAMKAMRAGKAYPDGAMFAKVAFSTTADEAFPNSLHPTKVTRVQLMEKNQKRYAETNGWGYALHPEELRRGRDPLQAARECHACHVLVKNRDYVFSTPSFFDVASATAQVDKFGAAFTVSAVNSLPAPLQDALKTLGDQSVNVRHYVMPLFAGSVEESIGPLSLYAARDKGAYVLADPESRHFLVAVPLPYTEECANRVGVIARHADPEGRTRTRKGVVCNGKAKLEPATISD